MVVFRGGVNHKEDARKFLVAWPKTMRARARLFLLCVCVGKGKCMHVFWRFSLSAVPREKYRMERDFPKQRYARIRTYTASLWKPPSAVCKWHCL